MAKSANNEINANIFMPAFCRRIVAKNVTRRHIFGMIGGRPEIATTRWKSALRYGSGTIALLGVGRSVIC
jgi:hypothetical protein